MLGDEELAEIRKFLTDELNIIMPVDFEKFSDYYKREYLQDALNRPIRVYGTVLSKGRPRGEPFEVKK